MEVINMKRIVNTLSVAITLLISSACGQASDKSLTQDQIVGIATQAYVFGYPLVLMDYTKRALTNVAEPTTYGFAPINQVSHYRSFPDHNFTAVVKPNVDTYYSSMWYDLLAEPMVLSVPETDRYYLLPLLDAFSNVFASPGPRTTGTKAQDFLIAGPNYQGDTPEGMTLLQSPTNTVWMIGRTKVLNAEDGATVVRNIQDGYKIVPLSSFGKEYNPPKGVVSEEAKTIIPAQDTENLLIDEFFNLMAELMVDNPAAPADAEIVKSMASIGIVPGKKFDIKSLDKQLQEKLKAIPSEVHKKFEETRSVGDPNILINGWQVYTEGIGSYGTNYGLRAYVAYVGLGANLNKDATYPVIATDQNGDQFMSENNYTLHFEEEEIPPVNGFWSLTLYDKRDFLAESAINRYALGDRDELVYNSDGSLDIYIQQSSPGANKEANWLPTPLEGKFNLTLRLYWPKEAVLNRIWNVPPVVKVE